MKLHRSDATLRSTRAYFDEVLRSIRSYMNGFALMRRSLMTPALNPESSKSKNVSKHRLTAIEKAAVKSLLLEPITISSDEGCSSILESSVKRLQVAETKFKSSYIDTRFLLPTSNICERFFSIAGYDPKNCRKAVLPANLESKLLLIVNKAFWEIDVK